MSKYNRFLIALFSDTHGGHTLGLLNPNTVIKEYDQEGQEYNRKIELGSSQQFIWDLYTSHVKELQKIADNDEIFLFHLGDLTQGNKYKDQLVYHNIYGQVQVAYHNMLPLVSLKNVKTFRLAFGTQSHIFQENTAPRMVWDKLCAKFPKKDIKAVPHGLIDIKGITLDYAHHGFFPGSRNWLKGNTAIYDVKSRMMDEIDNKKTPPRLIVRGHYHEKLEVPVIKFSNGFKYETTGIMCPSYTLLSDHARQAAKSPPRVTNGMCAIEVINGRVHYIHWLTKTTDVRVKETIK
jgi:hypothetical protein